MKPVAFAVKNKMGRIEFVTLYPDEYPELRDRFIPLYAIDFTKYAVVPRELSKKQEKDLYESIIISADGKQVWDDFIPKIPDIEDLP